jgi:hypothetical protein
MSTSIERIEPDVEEKQRQYLELYFDLEAVSVKLTDIATQIRSAADALEHVALADFNRYQAGEPPMPRALLDIGIRGAMDASLLMLLPQVFHLQAVLNRNKGLLEAICPILQPLPGKPN